jgi:hypothetical protein
VVPEAPYVRHRPRVETGPERWSMQWSTPLHWKRILQYVFCVPAADGLSCTIRMRETPAYKHTPNPTAEFYLQIRTFQNFTAQKQENYYSCQCAKRRPRALMHRSLSPKSVQNPNEALHQLGKRTDALSLRI